MTSTFVADAGEIVSTRPTAAIPANGSSRSSRRPLWSAPESEVVEVAAAFGDLVDIKVTVPHGHAQEDTRLAIGAARRLGLEEARRQPLEIAATDPRRRPSGRVERRVEKPGSLTSGEWEQVRMHAYYSERDPGVVAGRSSPVRDRRRGCTTNASTARDTTGARPRRPFPCRRASWPPRTRSPRWSDQARTAPPSTPSGPPAPSPPTRRPAARPDAAAAVLAEAGQRPAADAGTTGRAEQREVEVLGLIARGRSNAAVAERLFISRRTAEHHAQHIYAKIGVSTRAAAALFAVEHGLVP